MTMDLQLTTFAPVMSLTQTHMLKVELSELEPVLSMSTVSVCTDASVGRLLIEGSAVGAAPTARHIVVLAWVESLRTTTFAEFQSDANPVPGVAVGETVKSPYLMLFICSM